MINIIKSAGAVIFALSTLQTHAAIIDFEKIPTLNIPQNYQNLIWDKIYAANKYAQPQQSYTTGTTSGNISAWSAYPIASIKSEDGQTFDAGTVNVTSAFENQSIYFRGYKNNKLVKTTKSYSITTDNFLAINIDIQEIDELRIHSNLYKHWIMDDLELIATFIPEPTSAANTLPRLNRTIQTLKKTRLT